MQRALHLAADLAAELLADAGDAAGDADFAALAERGTIDRDLATRLAGLLGERLREDDVTDGALIDLDVFLRSVEQGAPAKPLPLPPLGSAPKLPPGTQRASVNVSGRVISVVGRDGRAFILVDDRPVGQPFDLPAIPMSASELEREPDGSVRIDWPGQLRLVVAPDFASARVELLVA
jgi:hypothetical protein